MIVLKYLALFTLGFLNLAVGLAVLMRDSKRISNALFACMVFAIGGWVLAIGAFLLSDSKGIALVLAKIYYVLPLVITAATVLFAKAFPGFRRIPINWWLLTLAGLLSLSVPLLLSPTFITQDILYHEWGKEVVLNKVHYFFYALYLLLCIAAALALMYKAGRGRQGLYAAQARLFFSGFLISVLFAIYFNLILPWVGNYRLIHIGPLFTNVFIIAIAYSIVRHRMFDVRLVVARSMAYILSIVVLVIGYSALSFAIASQVLVRLNNSGEQAVEIMLLIFVALTYASIRRFFNKVTSRVFYRDAYDPQELLDNLNRVLVGTVELELLLKRSAEIIQKNLKADFCLFGIKETATVKQLIVGTGSKQFDEQDIRLVRGLTPHIHHKVIVTDYLDEGDEKLRGALQRYDVAVLARLIGSTKKVAEGTGYLVLGPKRSGNPYNNQDIKILEIIVNELVIAIQNSLRFEEIENFNVTLQQKVTDATRQLRQANDKLKALDESKDEFIGMASHQLRTPLTSVKGYISMVIDGDAGKVSEKQRKMLNRAFVSSQRMVYLIADLLNVSRLKTGKFVIENKPTNLADLIEGEMSQLMETAKARDLQLTYKKPADFPTLMLDETKIRQVVMNFIDNAVYYTPQGGHIVVAVSEKPDSVELTVTDDGIGVPKHEQHQLFTKFYRAGNARKARPDGTGLGLFMAKKVIVAQGGAIIFSSREGHGSTFGFTIPKQKIQINP
jgi:signal transduction histidine kinase